MHPSGRCAVHGNNPQRRQLAKRVQLVEGAMAALDHAWNDIVAPLSDRVLEHCGGGEPTSRASR
jgi:hypothetical protein